MDSSTTEPSEREIQRLQANRDELVERLARAIRHNGTAEPVAGLMLRRESTPTELGHGMSYLSFCLIAQGSKEILLGGNRYRLDPAQYLIATAALPIASRIVEASPERPYLALVLSFDPILIGPRKRGLQQAAADAGSLSFRPDAHDLVYVSGAHEMLHAVYEQLPPDYRLQIDRQLEAALPQLDQCRVDTNLRAYDNQMGAERTNELHSVLATEFGVLPPGLQSHFSRYFSNRQLVVSAHDRTLGHREEAICGQRSRLDQIEAQLKSLQQRLQRQRPSGNLAAYNALVDRHNALAREQNRAVDAYNRRVREHNQFLESIGGEPGTLSPREPARSTAQ
jgi:uncharacterized coiled-coil protein SlyX